MKKGNNSKTLMILMIICVCLSLATLGIVIYDRFIRKEPEHAVLKPLDNNGISYKKIDDSKGTYYIQQGDTYQIYWNDGVFDNGGDFDESKLKAADFEKVDTNYPIINIDTPSVRNINDKIKEIYNKVWNLSTGHEGCVCLKKDGKVMCDEHVLSPSYNIKETDKFITVIINENYVTGCASGLNNIITFTIDKKTGKEMTNDEIANYFGYTMDQIYNNLAKYLLNEHNDIISQKEIDEYLKDSISLLINNSLSPSIKYSFSIQVINPFLYLLKFY